MNTKFTAVFLLAFCGCFAQDVIYTRYNAAIQAEIKSEGKATITYTKPDVPGNNYVIDKGDVKEIKYQDGRFAEFPADLYEGLSPEETAAAIKKVAEAYAYDNDKDRNRFKIEFKDAKLHVTKESDTRIYDFRDVKSFMPVSKKEGDKAAIGIWVMTAANKQATKWEKGKLTIYVEGQDNAYELYNLLKHLNKALKAQK
ncbi:hypothetical protein [Flavobacterium selenitireducens]|uniref:hypothetical protein n=1 Tax=Flavobacterium selenitireducens TaxID=2722704 RepID=UPI00168B80A5|nr:hypothetical protein [Flavobacterium selenitireducens]MBD3581240.1 hypothetical protein [Flavobacterium selenitireducens]